MPYSTGTAPNGEKFDFYVPDDVPDEQIPFVAARAYRLKQLGVDVTQPPPPPERTLGGYLGEIPRGIAGGAAGLIESGLTGASFLLPEEQEQAARASIARGGQAVQDAIGPKANYRDTPFSKLMQATGSTLPMLAMAPFGIAGLAAGVGTGIAAGAGQAAQRATAAGATEDQISEAAGLGMLPGALEFFPPAVILGRFNTLRKAVGDKTATNIMARLGRVGGAGAGEGLQEVVSEIGQNLIAQGVYDPDTGTFTGTGESFGYGAGVGALIQGLMELAIRGRPRPGPADQEPRPGPADQEPLLALPPPQPKLPAPEQLALPAPEGIAGLLPAPPKKGAPEPIEPINFNAPITPVDFVPPQFSQGPQGEMFPAGEQTAPQTSITIEQAEAAGLPKGSAVTKRLAKLDLADPEQRAMAVTELQSYGKRFPKFKAATTSLLAQDIMQPEFVPDRGLVQQENIADRPEQITIEEGIADQIAREEAQNQKDAETERAYASRQTEPTAMEIALRKAQEEEILAAGQQTRAAENAAPVTEQATQDVAPVEPETVAQDATPAPVVETPTQQAAPVVETPTQQAAPVVEAPTEQTAPVTEAIPETPTVAKKAPAKKKTPVAKKAPVETKPPAAPKVTPSAKATVDPAERTTELEGGAGKESSAKLKKSAARTAPPMPKADKETLGKKLGEIVNRPRKPRETNNKPLTEGEAAGVYFYDDAPNVAIRSLAFDIATNKDQSDLQKATTDKAESWVRKNLTQQTQRALDEQIAEYRKLDAKTSKQDDAGVDLDLRLMLNAVDATVQKTDAAVNSLLESGDLKGALEKLADTVTNPTVKRVAKNLASAIKNTKVELVSSLSNPSGDPAAGLYDPKTDTIKLVGDNLSIHTLLHEATHAATSHVLANKSHPVTKQLTNIFNDLKDQIDTAYGSTSLDEFVAESFSNPEFQAKLSTLTPKGNPISYWTRFKTAIGNMVRSLLGMPSKTLESAQSKVDELVESILSPAPDARDARPLYEATLNNTEDTILNSLWKGIRGKDTNTKAGVVVGSAMETVTEKARRLGISALPMNALADTVAKTIPAAKTLWKTLQLKAGARQDYLQKISDVARGLDGVFAKSPAQKKIFNYVVHESTRAGVDPTKDLDYYESHYVDWRDDKGKEHSSRPFKDKLEARKYAAKKREQFGKDAVAERGGDSQVVENYKRIKDEFDKLSGPQQDAYETLRDAYSKMYNEIKESLEDRINALEIDPTARKSIMDQVLKQMLSKQRLEPYFPLFRRGEFWITYTTGNNTELYKEAYESRQAMNLAKLELEKDPRVDKDSIQVLDRRQEMDKQRKQAQQVPTSFAFGLMQKMKEAKVGPEAENIILDVLLDVMPERSLARTLRTREGVMGFQEDAIQVFRERSPEFATQIVNLKYDLPLTKIGKDIGEQAAASGTKYDADVAVSLQKSIEFSRSPVLAGWSRALKSATFGMTLGVNVSSVMVNWTNIPIVVQPYLGGIYGNYEAGAALVNAKKNFFTTGTKRRVKDMDGATDAKVMSGPSITNIDYSKKDEIPKGLENYDVLAEVMEARGQANRTMVGDQLDLDNPANTWWTKTNSIMGLMFHQGERLNRQVTAMASSDLYLKKKFGDKKEYTREQKLEAAEHALEVTEFTNGGAQLETAPRLAQSDFGSLALMYKRFGISMYYLQAKTAYAALKSVKPEDRAAARKQLVGIFASSALMAGVQGVPMYGVVAMIGNMFLDDEEEDFDTLAAGFFGEGMYSGPINAVFGVDIASRIGMSNLIFRTLPNKEQDSLALRALELVGGPAFGIASRMEDGIQLINEGQVVRGIEKVLPSALSNAFVKAPRYATSGVTTMRGDPIVDSISGWNIFAQALGLAPAEYTKQMEINAVNKRIDRKLTEKRTNLLRRYYIESSVGDVDAAMDTLEKMIELGERHPAFGIDGETVKKSREQHQRTSELVKLTGGVTQSARFRREAMERQRKLLGED